MASLQPITWAPWPNLSHFWLILASKTVFFTTFWRWCGLYRPVNIIMSPKFVFPEIIYFFRKILIFMIFWCSQPEVDHIISRIGSKIPSFGQKSIKKWSKISIRVQVMHHRLAGGCPKFEKFYFLKEIYIIFRKIKFGSILVLTGWSRPDNLQKWLQNTLKWVILAKFYDFICKYSAQVLYHRSVKNFQNFTKFSFFLRYL